MDETTKAIIDKITIQYDTPTRIPSGHTCKVFFDCFQLSPNDMARLAADAVGHLEHDYFDVAVGLAYSGILFSAAVAGGRQVVILQRDGKLFGPDLKGKKVLVVDDVIFSGTRIRNAFSVVRAAGGEVVGTACIVDRSEGRVADLKLPLWSAIQSPMI